MINLFITFDFGLKIFFVKNRQKPSGSVGGFRGGCIARLLLEKLSGLFAHAFFE